MGNTAVPLDVMPPELSGPRPRRVKPRAILWLHSCVFAPGLVLLAVLLAGMGFGILRQNQLLLARGRSAEGQLISVDPPGKASTQRSVRYWFTDAEGRAHETYGTIWEGVGPTRRGDAITVTYLPDDPTVSRPWQVNEEHAAYVFQMEFNGGVFWVLAILGAAWLIGRDARLHRWLGQHGEPTVAICIAHSTSRKGGVLYVTYALQYAKNGTYPRKVVVPRWAYEALQDGQGLVVLYDPRHPERSLPYLKLNVRVIG
jgi:hypothetical protein